MLTFINIYFLLMLPIVISVQAHIRSGKGKAPEGFTQHLVLFINIIINMPFWYILFVKELFKRKK
jgi:hypothetical protein